MGNKQITSFSFQRDLVNISEFYSKTKQQDHKIALELPPNHLASAEVKESAKPAGLAGILPLLSSRLA